MKRLILLLSIIISYSSCQQKSDFVFDDDEIRLIINKRIVDYKENIRKYTIDKRDYKRILISKNLLEGKSTKSLTVFEVDTKENYHKIISVAEGSKYPEYFDFMPYEENNYFVYELDKLPPKLFLKITVITLKDPIITYDGGFEIEINKSKVFNKKKS